MLAFSRPCAMTARMPSRVGWLVLTWTWEALRLAGGFLLPLLGLALTALVLGRTVSRRLGFAGKLERWTVALALGLALSAHLLLFLGLAGLLRPVPVLVVAAGVGSFAWLGRQGPQGQQGPQGRENFSAHVPAVPEVPEVPGVPAVRWALAAAAFAPFLLLALYPPTAFDATLYHLPFARAFVESGGVPYVMDRRVPVFPQANEILFAAVMMFGRDVAAQGVQLLMTLCTAALAFLWGRRTWPERPWAGGLAAAIFLGNPLVAYLAGTAYIEAGLTLFVTAALYGLDRWREEGGRGWLALSALFAATACDVKYLGLFFLGIAGLGVLVAGRQLRDVLLFAAVALAFLAPWYLRIYAFHGNPLFPYLPGIFGHNVWNPIESPESPPPGEHLVRWLRLPWDLVFARRSYNSQPPLSPVYLAALPLLLLGAWRDARLRLALLIVGIYTFVFTFLPPDPRYLEPVLPLASLAVAGSLARVWARGRPRSAIAALCLVCFLPGWLYAGYRIRKQGPPPLSPAAREAYLDRQLPLYPAIAWLNRTLGPRYTVWALYAENMAFYADGRFLGDWFGPASYPQVLREVQGPGNLAARLRRLGADHLLVTTRIGGLPFPEDGPEAGDFRRWFAPVYADPAARVYALR